MSVKDILVVLVGEDGEGGVSMSLDILLEESA